MMDEARWRRSDPAKALGFSSNAEMIAHVKRIGFDLAADIEGAFDRVDTAHRTSGPLMLPVDMGQKVNKRLKGFWGFHVAPPGYGEDWIGILAADTGPMREPFLSPDQPTYLYEIDVDKSPVPLFVMKDPKVAPSIFDLAPFGRRYYIPPAYILFAPQDHLHPSAYRTIARITPREVVARMAQTLRDRGRKVPSFEDGDPVLLRAWDFVLSTADPVAVETVDDLYFLVPDLRYELDAPVDVLGREYTDDDLVEWATEMDLISDYAEAAWSGP